jgi:hypothetical protein
MTPFNPTVRLKKGPGVAALSLIFPHNPGISNKDPAPNLLTRAFVSSFRKVKLDYEGPHMSDQNSSETRQESA